MRVATLFLLPTLAFSFVSQHRFRTVPTSLTSDAVNDICKDVVSKTEAVIEKADSLVLKRAMRFVNHLPAYYTLQKFAIAAGSCKLGVDAAASVFSYSSPSLLPLPVWLNNIWKLSCIFQVGSLTKSALASDEDELSQSDITSLAAANFAAAKALSSGSLQWLVATSILSSYSARSGASSDLTIHNGSIQLISSFTTVAAILGVTAALPNVVPFLGGQQELLAVIGLASAYAVSTRAGNGTVKKVVNASVIGGILLSKIAGGALALSMSNLLQLGTIVTVGTAYVAFESIKTAKEALNSA